jgi:hypothetical protein
VAGVAVLAWKPLRRAIDESDAGDRTKSVEIESVAARRRD